MDIENFDEDNHQEQMDSILSKEIDYIEALLNKKAVEIRQSEIVVEKMRTEIRELKSKLDKKKIAKSIMLDEKIPKKPKIKKVQSLKNKDLKEESILEELEKSEEKEVTRWEK